MLKVIFLALLSINTYSLEPRVAMGHGLYVQKGANSCLYCHGVDGANGKVKTAANLAQPKTWKVYKMLGGDSALNANRLDFISKLDQVIISVIQYGSLKHNSSFKEPWYSETKMGGKYDGQMLGLNGAPSKKWLKKYKSRGVTDKIASESVLMYLKTLDTQGIFKN